MYDRGKIPKSSGIYFLYDNEMNLQYIGKAINLKNRVKTSAYEKDCVYFCRYSLYDKCDIDLVEIILIKRYRPIQNKIHNIESKIIVEMKENPKSEPLKIMGLMGREKMKVDDKIYYIKNDMKPINKKYGGLSGQDRIMQYKKGIIQEVYSDSYKVKREDGIIEIVDMHNLSDRYL